MIKDNKNSRVLDRLFSAIAGRDGPATVTAIKNSPRTKRLVGEAVSREMIVQIIAEETVWVRVKFLALYPEYLLPYLIRVRGE